MKKRIEPIEIKDPPIQEIQRKKSCFGRSCSLGCFLFLLLMIGVIVFLRFSAVARPKTVRQVPEQVSQALPIYDKDAIEKITVLSGKKKEKAVQTAARLPDIVVKKIFSTLGNSEWDEFIATFENDIKDNRDTITISWKDLTAEPRFIIDYYKTNLKRAGFRLNEKNNSSTISFVKNDIDGTLTVNDNDTSRGTDALVLSIRIPTN